MAISSEPDPLRGIIIGSPIYTRDYQKIGTVMEMGATALKVGTPRLQRDYWLPRSTIRSIAVDGAVMLSIDKVQLGSHKLGGPR